MQNAILRNNININNKIKTRAFYSLKFLILRSSYFIYAKWVQFLLLLWDYKCYLKFILCHFVLFFALNLLLLLLLCFNSFFLIFNGKKCNCDNCNQVEMHVLHVYTHIPTNSNIYTSTHIFMYTFVCSTCVQRPWSSSFNNNTQTRTTFNPQKIY